MKRYEEIFWENVYSKADAPIEWNKSPYITNFSIAPTNDLDKFEEYDRFSYDLMKLAEKHGYKPDELPEIAHRMETNSCRELLDACLVELNNEAKDIDEIWRDVRGYEDYLEVSQIGRFRSKITGNIIKGGYSNGYRKIGFRADKRQAGVMAHRAVAIAFPEITGYSDKNDKRGYVVNHKDENKFNNHACNLEHITPKENSNHGTTRKRLGFHDKPKPGRKIKCVETGEVFNSIKSAAEFYVTTRDDMSLDTAIAMISACLRKIRPRAFGYHFEYIDE